MSVSPPSAASDGILRSPRFIRMALAMLLPVVVAGSLGANPVRGVVISEAGAPVANAVIRAFAPESSAQVAARLLSESPARKPIAQASSERNGEFAIDLKDAPAADLELTAGSSWPVLLRVTAGEDLGPVAVPLPGEVKGWVRAGGKTVPDAIVAITVGEATVIARSGDDGSYVIPPVRAKDGRITVVHPEHAIEVREFTRTDGLPLELSLGSGVVIGGVAVAADATPVPDAVVSIDGWPLAVTGEDGSFRIARAPGRWRELTIAKESAIGVASRGPGELKVTMRPGVILTGVVTSHGDRKPVPGARVSAGPAATPPRQRLEQVAIADGKGRYRLGPLVPGTWEVSASAAGHVPDSSTVEARAGAAAGRNFGLRRSASIEGTVVDPSRKAIAGARVTPGGAFSGPGGRFVLRELEPAEPVPVSASHRAYASSDAVEVKLTAGARTKGVVAALKAGFPLQVRVTDMEGAPIAGAEVRSDHASTPYSPRASWPQKSDPLVTGKDGIAELRLEEGLFDLVAIREGFAPGFVASVSLPSASPVIVKLVEGAVLTGRVVREGGAPVADASVIVFDYPVQRNLMVRTGLEGEFAFRDLEPGELQVMVRKQEEFVTATRTLSAPATDAVIEIAAGGTVRGRVLEKETKRPVPAFEAGISGDGGRGRQWWSPSAKPALKSFQTEDGAFVLANVPEGSVDLVVAAPGFVEVVHPINVDASAEAEPIEIFMEEAAQVSGTVKSGEGEPLSGAWITVKPQEGSPRRLHTTSDAAGEYTLAGVPQREVVVGFFREGYLRERKTVSPGSKGARLDVVLNRGLELAGIVVSHDGRPVSGVELEVESSGVDSPYLSTRSDAAGAFHLSGLSPGVYSLTAVRGGYPRKRLHEVRVPAEGPVRIVFDEGGTIHGMVSGTPPRHARSVRVMAAGEGGLSEAYADESGRYRLEGIASGRVVVSASVDTAGTFMSTPETSVEISPGSTAQVDLRFREGHEIRGRLFRNGRPMGGAGIWFSRGEDSFGGATSAADGTYSLTIPGTGEHQVSVRIDRESFQTDPYTVTGPGTFDIHLRTQILRGRVTDRDTGRPLPGATVSLRVKEREGDFYNNREVKTDSGGRFVFREVSSDRYSIAVQLDGYGAEAVDVAVGEESIPDLSVVLAESGGVLLRVADDRDGRPLAGWFTVSNPAGGIISVHYNVESRNGLQRLPLAAGTYDLSVFAEGLAPRVLRISVPSPEVHVSLTPGGTLVVKSPAEGSQKARLIQANGAIYTLWQGRRDFFLAPGVNTHRIAPGTYTLALLDANGNVKTSKQVTVEEGRTAEVTF